MNFKKIKEAVSISQVLEHYGILESLKKRGASYRGNCPFCESDDNNPFSVSLEKNCFNAFCCGEHGNVLDFIAAKENISIKQAAEFLNNLFKVEKKPAKKKAEMVDGKSKDDQPMQAVDTNKPLGFTLDGIDPTHPYVSELGVSEETARTFGAGFFSGRGMFKNHFVMPVYSFDGDLIAYTGFKLDDPKIPVYPAKFDPTIELFAKYRLCERDKNRVPLIVCQHPLEVLSLAGHKYEAVALMGEEITQEQVRLLNRCCGTSRKLILFMADNDEGTVGTLSVLIPYFYVRMVRFERDPDDPYTFDKETLEMLEI